MEQDKRSEEELVEHYAYDVRSDRLYRFRRMKKYVLLQGDDGRLMKINEDEFNLFFEGLPPPQEPLLIRIR